MVRVKTSGEERKRGNGRHYTVQGSFKMPELAGLRKAGEKACLCGIGKKGKKKKSFLLFLSEIKGGLVGGWVSTSGENRCPSLRARGGNYVGNVGWGGYGGRGEGGGESRQRREV